MTGYRSRPVKATAGLWLLIALVDGSLALVGSSAAGACAFTGTCALVATGAGTRLVAFARDRVARRRAI